MFDFSPRSARDSLLARIRCFVTEHGHDLARVALLLGGAAAEARVVSAALSLEAATGLDRRLKQDLEALLRILTSHDVCDPDEIVGPFRFPIDSASRDVETICLLTDMLNELLRDVDAMIGRPSRPLPKHAAAAA